MSCVCVCFSVALWMQTMEIPHPCIFSENISCARCDRGDRRPGTWATQSVTRERKDMALLLSLSGMSGEIKILRFQTF